MRKSRQSFPQQSNFIPTSRSQDENEGPGNDHMGMGWLILGLTYQQGE